MQQDLYLRLWQEERADIRQRLLLAVVCSAACLVAGGLLLGLALVAVVGQDAADAMGVLIPAAFTLMGLGGAGWAVVAMCRRDIAEHHRRAAQLQRTLPLPVDVQLQELPPPRSRTGPRPQSGQGLLTSLHFVHWGVFLCGLTALLVATSG
ncbi:hypothetical protein [Catellatospora sp. NPDC049609]|uniref:hypothetical protein n=1 Tax=Catellatospora sp. NPDC049609 TaxID=3155505 RepID=UPI00343B4F06